MRAEHSCEAAYSFCASAHPCGAFLFDRNFLSNKKNPVPIYMKTRSYFPCYHFNSLAPHEISLCRCQPTSSAITGGPVRTYLPPATCGLSVQFCHSKAIFHPHSFFPSQHPSGGKFSVKFLQMYSLFQRVIKVYSVITNYNNWLSAMITLSLDFQKVNLFLYYSSKILRCAPHLSQYVCSFGCFAPHCGQMTAPCVTRISSFNA